MSTVILTKDETNSCDIIETVVAITTPTQFTLTSNQSVSATIVFNNMVVANLTPTNLMFIAVVAGDYTVRLSGPCTFAQVCIDDVVDPPVNIAAPALQQSDVLIDCDDNTTSVDVNQIVSIAGSERAISVRVVENCEPLQSSDYEIVCASTDGRLLLLNASESPPELTEIDGSAIGDAATAINCDVEYVAVDKCFQDIDDNTVQYTRIITYPVGDSASATVIWLDSSGVVIVEPANIEVCASEANCDIGPASGIVCYEGANGQTRQVCGEGNNWTDLGGNLFETTMWFDGEPYTVQLQFDQPAAASDEDCDVDLVSEPNGPHPSYVALDAGGTATITFSPVVPNTVAVTLDMLHWGAYSPLIFSVAPDSSTPEVEGETRSFTWDDGSTINGLTIELDFEGDNLYFAGQYGFADVIGQLEAFVFHQCDGTVLYRDTVTNEIIEGITVIDCDAPQELVHELTYGTDINVPQGARSVVISRISGNVVIDGAFTLAGNGMPNAISFNADELSGGNTLLPEITIMGGSWQWAAVLPALPPPVPVLGFDALTLGADLQLTNSNFTIETIHGVNPTSPNNGRTGYAKTGNNLYYAEVLADFNGINQAYIGVCNTDHLNTDRVGYSPDSAGLFQNGAKYTNSILQGVNGLLNYSALCTVRIWFNPFTGNVWFGVDANVDGDPANQLSPSATMTGGVAEIAVTPWRLVSTFELFDTTSTITYSPLGATPAGD